MCEEALALRFSLMRKKLWLDAFRQEYTHVDIKSVSGAWAG